MPITMHFSTLSGRPDRSLNTHLTNPVDAITAIVEVLSGLEPGASYVPMAHTSRAEATIALRSTLRTATIRCDTNYVVLTEPSGVRQDVCYPDSALTSSETLTRIAVRISAFLRSGIIVPATFRKATP